MRKGFTLIELLIVVAIIAILAAIAVPNFLEAQLRSKIARAKADMRTVSLGVSSYTVDHNIPPHTAGRILPGKQWNRDGICLFTNLTTPIAYLTSVNTVDPFASVGPGAYNEYGVIPPDPDGGGTDRSHTLHLINIIGMARGWGEGTPLPAISINAEGHPQRFLLLSLGPDYHKGPDPRPGVANPFNWAFSNYGNANDYKRYDRFIAWTYDPSNGTVSNGDVFRWGD